MPKLNISVCILALNEQENLKTCLDSVKSWVDEIVVGVDDQTTDKTELVARKYTDRVYRLKHRDMFHKNKQLVVDKATQPWVLWLDADEKVSKGLVDEIKKEIKKGVGGYYIPRKNFIFGKWIKHSQFWSPDYQLRLWKKGKVKWPSKSIHEHPIISGETKNLKEYILHNNYTSVSQFLDKLNKYSSLDAKRRKNEINPPYFKAMIKRPIEDFVKHFVAMKGYKDGLHGLALSLLQAFYELVVVIKIWEIDKFKDEEVDILKQVKKESVSALQSFDWWERELKIKKTGNKLKKFWHKGLRKFEL